MRCKDIYLFDTCISHKRGRAPCDFALPFDQHLIWVTYRTCAQGSLMVTRMGSMIVVVILLLACSYLAAARVDRKMGKDRI